MNESFSLLFYLKKPKDYWGSPLFIYARITIAGKRSELSTGFKCLPDKWNSKGGKPLGSGEDAKALLKQLDTVRRKVYEAHHSLVVKNIEVTVERLKNEYLGVSEKPRNIIGIFKEHNTKMEALIGHEYAAGTLERYKTSLRHTVDFLQWKFKVSDIDIKPKLFISKK